MPLNIIRHSFIYVLLGFFVSGCLYTDDNSAAIETVYVDPVAIAKALGRDNIIAEQQEAALTQLNSQLLRISSDLNRQLEEETDRLGDKPAEADKQKLNSLRLSANQHLHKTRLIAQKKLDDYKQQLISGFRHEITLIAKPIAEQRGATNISMIDGNVLWLNPDADITDEVIADLRAIASHSPPSQHSYIEQIPEKAAASSSEIQKLDKLVDEVSEQASN